MTTGVALDCYGTLMRIAHPLDATRRASLILRRSDAPSPMVRDIAMTDALIEAGCDPIEAETIGRDMAAEAEAVELLPGAIEAIALLRRAGIGIIIASNLSREYADPIRRLLPDVPAVLSFAAGCRKPEAAFFGKVAETLGVPIPAVTMVGDSRGSDHDGAVAAGMRAILLSKRTIDGVATAPDVLAAARVITKTA